MLGRIDVWGGFGLAQVQGTFYRCAASKTAKTGDMLRIYQGARLVAGVSGLTQSLEMLGYLI